MITEPSLRIIWFIAVTEIALAAGSPLNAALRDVPTYERCLKQLHAFLNAETNGTVSYWPSMFNQLTVPVLSALALLPAAYGAIRPVEAQQAANIRADITEFINHALERRGRNDAQSTDLQPHLARLARALQAAPKNGSTDGPRLLGTWLRDKPLKLEIGKAYPMIMLAARSFKVIGSDVFESYRLSWGSQR